MSRTSRGLIWSGIEQISVSGGAFIIGIIIARFVAPEAYGLVAMMQVFISFCQLFIEGGLTKALIQKINRTETDFNSIFIANVVIAFLLYILLYTCAPLISAFYKNFTLTLPFRILGFILIIQSFAIVQKSKLTISLNFKTQAQVSLIATLISGTVGIFYAVHGGGLWALIAQSLINQSILSIGLMFVTRWKPKFQFSVSSFKTLFKFGYNELIGNILTTFYLNLTNLLIGKFYSPSSLSFYNRGFQMAFFPSNILTNIISRTSFPILCEKQKETNNLITKYLEFLNLNCYLVFPLMTLLALLSHSIIYLLLGSIWMPAAKYVAIFSIVFALFPLNTSMIQIIYVIGKPQLNLKVLIIKRIISVLMLCITIPFGVDFVAYSLILGAIIDVIISGVVVARELRINFWKQFEGLGKICIGVSGIIIFCLILRILLISPLLLVSLSVLGSGIIYILLTFSLRMPQGEYVKYFVRKIYE